MNLVYDDILKAKKDNRKLLAVLIDPEKHNINETTTYLSRLPQETTHLFVGGSTGGLDKTEKTVAVLKQHSQLPVVLFPGNAEQITNRADALLFLSLISGNNPEYLIGQQLKAIPKLRKTLLEVIPTAYILIDGGRESAVARVSNTLPISQNDKKTIRNMAIAAFYLGKKLVYLEAGSGALFHVNANIIQTVKRNIYLPLIVGGGIRSRKTLREVWEAGADMAVIGTAFENNSYTHD